MPVTPVYNFPYPALGDPPNGPVQIGALASAVESELVRIDNAILPTVMGPAVENELAFYSIPLTRTTTQSITTTAETALSFNEPAAGDDRADMFVTGSPTRITIKVAGTYLMKFNASFALATASTYRAARIRLNGGGTTLLDTRYLSAPDSQSPLHLCGEYRFALLDYIEVLVYHENGSNLNIALTPQPPKISVRRIGV